MIVFLVRGRVRIKIRIRVGVMFNIRVTAGVIVTGANVGHSFVNGVEATLGDGCRQAPH